MNGSSSDVSARIVGLRRILVGLDERLAAAPSGSAVDPELLRSTRDALREVAEGLSEIQRGAVDTFETLFRTAPLALFVLDPTGRVVMWNEAAVKMFGWSESEVKGALPPYLDPKDVDEFRDNLERAVLGGGFQGREVVRHRKGGGEITIRVSAAALHDGEGSPVGAVCIAEDVSGRKREENAKLRIARLEALGVLAGGLAHDFNNVLMVVTGNLCLARAEADPVLRGELLDEAQDAARRAVALTARLVTFAKGGAPAKEVVDLPAIVSKVVDRALTGTSIAGEVGLRATLPLEADPVQLREALRGIVVNAREAMPDGGRLTVSADDITEDDGSRLVRISISDTGAGIEPEFMDRIFDPYYSTKSSGAGLGLSAAHSVIAQHGGRIEVESIPGRGSTFHLFLPAGQAAGEPADPADCEAGQVDDSRRVLVVDDEDMVRGLLARMLERLGYATVLCASGEEAVAVFRDAVHCGERFSAVITDLTMPGGMGGIETARALREIDGDVRVMVSSGYSDDPAVARYADFGFTGSVRKPYSLDALRAALEKTSHPSDCGG